MGGLAEANDRILHICPEFSPESVLFVQKLQAEAEARIPPSLLLHTG